MIGGMIGDENPERRHRSLTSTEDAERRFQEFLDEPDHRGGSVLGRKGQRPTAKIPARRTGQSAIKHPERDTAQLLAENYGSPLGRAAVLYITNDLPQLTARLEPVTTAGLRARVLATPRDGVSIARDRIVAFLPFHLSTESWSTYTQDAALTALRTRYGRPDDADAESYWTALAAGQQVMVWDPAWNRNDRLWPALRAADLPQNWA